MRACWCLLIAACATPPVVEQAPDELPVPTDDAGDALPSAGSATLRDGTFVLPSSIAKTAVVEFYSVMFPAAGNEALLALERGNVIVSGSGDGFIRRVYSVARDGQSIRITTSPATLADAVVTATFHMSVAEPIAVAPHADARNEYVTASIDGALAITPAIDVDFALDADGLDAFEIHVDGTGTSSVEGTIAFETDTHRAWGDETSSTTPLFRRAYALGPLPIVVVGRLTTTLGASAYVEMPVTFATGARATFALDATTRYVPGGGWTMDDATSIDLTQIGPLHTGGGQASLAISMDPKIELAFYGAGPSLHFVAQAGGFGAYCGPTLITGLQAAVQGSAHLELATLVKTPDARITLWDQRPFLDELEACNN